MKSKQNKMTELGIAPRLALISFLYFFVVLIINRIYPDMSLLPQKFSLFYTIVGLIIFFLGFIMYVIGAKVIRSAYREERLVTYGIFSIVRNPMYSGILIFVFIGIAFLLGYWLMFSVPVVAYIAFKLLIKKEEDYLEEKFGQDYIDYKLEVNAIIPFPHFSKRK